jgi:uncharacterized lipoprotein YajG
MKRLTEKPLMGLISLLLLSGCTNTPLPTNTCPAPVFPSCEVIDAALASESDSIWKYLLRSDNVMLKLREGQEKNERDKFVDCPRNERNPVGDTSK